MNNLIRPLVLVHGLWNSPKLFDDLVSSLNQNPHLLLIPHLPHDLGRVSIRNLAADLDIEIKKRFGPEMLIDILGFSMGGLISRVWIQEMNGFNRTKRFITVGPPHNGTVTAQFVPTSLFPGIADMKINSELIKSLRITTCNLQGITCISFFSVWDLMVFPGYRAVMPFGLRIPSPVITHKGLVKNLKSIEMISNKILVRN